MIGELHDNNISFASWLPRNSIELLIESGFEYEIKKLIKGNKAYKQFLGDKKPNNKLSSKFVNVNNKYQKVINPDYLYITYIQNKGFIIADFKIGTVFCVNYKLEKFVASVDIVDLYEKNKLFFVIFGDKKGNLFMVRNRKGKFDHIFLYDVHGGLITTIRSRTHTAYNNSMLIATGSYDKTVKITRMKQIDAKMLYKDNFEELFVLRMKFRIMDIDWDPFNPFRLLNTCQKHVTVQVWDVSSKCAVPEELEYERKDKGAGPGDETSSEYVSNIRGHKGFITHALWSRFEPDCIMSCSDDQSVKMWNLVNIKSTKPPTKKKTLNKSDEVIMERNEEHEGDEYENNEYYTTDKFKHFTSGNRKRSDEEFNTPRK